MIPSTPIAPFVASPLCFPDGGSYRIEIPSCEGPAALRAVLAEADRRNVRINRVSQGSGIYMLTNDELAEMNELGRANRVEVCLFVGPRGSWGTGAQSRSAGGAALGACLRGPREFAAGNADIERAVAYGIRSVLVADLGHLSVLGTARAAGDLPDDLVFKTSVALPVANAAAARVLADLGADTLNVASDLDGEALASIRAAVDLPLDLYIESPDDLAGIVRLHETGELATIGAPMHLKFAVRNAPSIYPAGAHHASTIEALMHERVRRAALGIEQLQRTAPTLTQSDGVDYANRTGRAR